MAKQATMATEIWEPEFASPGESATQAPLGAQLVGSVPLSSAEEVFRHTSTALGDRLRRVRADAATAVAPVFGPPRLRRAGRTVTWQDETEDWGVHGRGLPPDAQT